MSKGTHGWEGSVGFLVAVCEARCGLAVEDTSKFVELHNILHKILVLFGILFLANSRHNMDDVVVRVLERQLGLRLSFLCGVKPPEAEFLACYIGFSVALDSEAPRFLVAYENLSLALLLMCFLLAGRYCSLTVVNRMKLA